MAPTVLLTGGSSFTGVWIAEALAEAGCDVIAPLLRERCDYAGVRLDRVRRLERCARVSFGRPFGSSAFLGDLADAGRVDVLAHHAAHISGYRDPTFDPLDALARNAAGATGVLDQLRRQGGALVVLTGTVFEAGEGGGSDAPAVTPYGLSKTLTREAFQYWANAAGLRFSRFVIPSPYGPMEEARFGWYLFRCWLDHRTPRVRTPLYVRDHLPAPQLAKAYAVHVLAALRSDASSSVARPSGWIAPQGDFARRMAVEVGGRLGRDCPIEFSAQSAFEEPRVRINDQPCSIPGWDEKAFWDQYVAWYIDIRDRGLLV